MEKKSIKICYYGNNELFFNMFSEGAALALPYGEGEIHIDNVVPDPWHHLFCNVILKKEYQVLIIDISPTDEKLFKAVKSLSYELKSNKIKTIGLLKEIGEKAIPYALSNIQLNTIFYYRTNDEASIKDLLIPVYKLVHHAAKIEGFYEKGFKAKHKIEFPVRVKKVAIFDMEIETNMPCEKDEELELQVELSTSFPYENFKVQKSESQGMNYPLNNIINLNYIYIDEKKRAICVSPTGNDDLAFLESEIEKRGLPDTKVDDDLVRNILSTFIKNQTDQVNRNQKMLDLITRKQGTFETDRQRVWIIDPTITFPEDFSKSIWDLPYDFFVSTKTTENDVLTHFPIVDVVTYTFPQGAKKNADSLKDLARVFLTLKQIKGDDLLIVTFNSPFTQEEIKTILKHNSIKNDFDEFQLEKFLQIMRDNPPKQIDRTKKGEYSPLIGAQESCGSTFSEIEVRSASENMITFVCEKKLDLLMGFRCNIKNVNVSVCINQIASSLGKPVYIGVIHSITELQKQALRRELLRGGQK